MMRRKLTLGIVALWVCVPGCRLASSITHNVCFETVLCADEVCGDARYCWLAYTAWKEYQDPHPGPYSSDFGKGFRAGFIDYLKAGGNGCAPPFPPQKYWLTCYLNPEKRQAALAWSEGFKEGAAAAKASGYREQIVLPLSVCQHSPPPAPAPHPTGPALEAPSPQVPVTAPPRPEDLPAPRRITPQPAAASRSPRPDQSAYLPRDVQVSRTGQSTKGGVVWEPNTAKPNAGPIRLPREAGRPGGIVPSQPEPNEGPVLLSRDDPGTLFGGSTRNRPTKTPRPPQPEPSEGPVLLSLDDPGTLFGGSTRNSPAKSP